MCGEVGKAFYLSVLKEIQSNIRRGIEAPIRAGTASSSAIDFAIERIEALNRLATCVREYRQAWIEQPLDVEGDGELLTSKRRAMSSELGKVERYQSPE